LTINKGDAYQSVMDASIKDRRVFHRSTQSGGIEYGSFGVRDNVGSLRYNTLRAQWGSKDLSTSGHTESVGSSSAEYLDDSDLRSTGYSFRSTSSDAAVTGEAAYYEARLSQREAVELSDQRSVDGFGRRALQVEDYVVVQYAPASGGDAPTMSAWTGVLTSIGLNAENGKLTGTYKLRLYSDLPS